jgi:hypothetical protein
MKLECSCGSKSEFEVRPEMRDHPVQFVCASCGLDSSEFVDALVRRELGQTGKPVGTPVPAVLGASPKGLALQVASDTPPVPVVRLSRSGLTSQAPSNMPVGAEAATCPKHPYEVASAKCYVCSKPICPQCMALFGYVCSPLCRAKAESHGIVVPVYAAQKSVVEARRWRWLVYMSSGAGVIIVLLLSFWFWYAWFGREPKPILSVRFSEPAYSGQSALAGNHKDQVVFLHGAVLSRYDLASGKQVWSRRIVEQEQVERAVARQMRANQAVVDKANNEAWEEMPKMPSTETLTKLMEREATASLHLQVRGEHLWVISPEKVTQYDWQTGQSTREFPLQAGLREPLPRGNELLFVSAESGKPLVTHLDLLTGTVRTDDLSQADTQAIAEQAARPQSGVQAKTNYGPAKPVDAAGMAARAQGMSLPEKLALPAVLAGNMNQQRAMKELNDSKPSAPVAQPGPDSSAGLSFIPCKEGFVELSVKLVERRIVSRSAMKPSSGKSVLEGDVTAGKSMELSTDMLNEMRRENGGDLVQEDHSRYQITLRRSGSASAWSAELVGPPGVYPLDTVTVVTADKLVIVLDKTNRKLWQSALTFNVVSGAAVLDEEGSTYGQGPCVERKGTLYLFDLGVLSAFELSTGNARWRLPTVGIAGLFFDDHDNLYVNTTSASHESLKFSKQIDLSQKISAIVLKLDARNGKVLWSAPGKGLVNYVSGKIVLTTQASIPEEEDGPETGLEKPTWLRIRRLNPANGREIWEHYEERVPLDIAFDPNTIRVVYKKEVQVLRFPRF